MQSISSDIQILRLTRDQIKTSFLLTHLRVNGKLNKSVTKMPRIRHEPGKFSCSANEAFIM